MTKELPIHIGSVFALRKQIKPDWRFWHTPNSELRDTGDCRTCFGRQADGGRDHRRQHRLLK
jgi:hypothetical protein